MRSAAVGAALAVALLGCAAPGEERPESSQSRTTATPPPSLQSLADLPTGRPPRLAYVVARSSVLFPDRSVDLEWDVDTITGSFVWDADAGTIHRMEAVGIDLVASDVTSPPVFDSTITWIERGDAIVRRYGRSKERQPLPAGCCDHARLVGVDVDMDPDVYVVADQGAWMWDTYEGREGLVNPPPDSQDYFWRIEGLGDGALTAVGISSEILVKYPNDQWGWGYVAGPRDPSSDEPVQYVEQERVSAARVWLSSRAIIALEPRGRLVVLGSRSRDDGYGYWWRELTGQRFAFQLPDGLEVDGVVAERSSDSTRRWTVLVDATDRSGSRAWVRCHLRGYECEIATELDADDLVPQE